MYHHLKIAESELQPSGKNGVLAKHSGPMPRKKIGFTVFYNGDIEKLISRIVFNVKRYGILIPNNFRYFVKDSDFIFNDKYNSTVWSVSIEKTKGIRYLNLQTEIQCLR